MDILTFMFTSTQQASTLWFVCGLESVYLFYMYVHVCAVCYVCCGLCVMSVFHVCMCSC